MQTFTTKLLLLFLVTALMTGCSSLKVLETWHKPVASPYTKIMVIGIAKDETKRKLYENIVVDELRQRMITSVASHTIVPELDKTNRAGMIDAVHKAGCDAVLTTRAMSVGRSSVTQMQPSGDPMGYVFGASPALSHGDFLKATLQTNLYDSKSQELVWSATFKTDHADREASLSREMGKFFFERLRKEGLL